MKKVAMFQSNYIPWKGYFDIIHDVDVFVFYDDVQYTTKDWRNRNRIKSKNGVSWLTVPVVHSELRSKKICEIEIDNSSSWAKKHFKAITLSYARSPFLKNYIPLLETLYLSRIWTNLSEMNRFFTKKICEQLGIDVEFFNLQDLGIDGDKNGERIIKICRELHCDYVLNGPSAKEFINQDLFDRSGITIEYKSYEYPIYQQLGTSFEHSVSILDVLFNTGSNAPYYIWDWRSAPKIIGDVMLPTRENIENRSSQNGRICDNGSLL